MTRGADDQPRRGKGPKRAAGPRQARSGTHEKTKKTLRRVRGRAEATPPARDDVKVHDRDRGPRRPRRLGVRQPPSRVRDLYWALLALKRRAHPDRPDHELRRLVRRDMPNYLADGAFMADYARMAPVSLAPARRLVNEWVMTWAIRQLGPIRWLLHQLADTPPRRDRSYAISVLCHLAWLRGHPSVSARMETLAPGAAHLQWAFGYPSHRAHSSVCKAVHRMARTDPRAAWHVNLALFRRLIKLYPEPKLGKGLPPVYPGGWLSVDAKPVRVWLPQQKPLSREHLRDLAGAKFERVGYRAYTDSKGGVLADWVGYLLCCICCVATGLPLIWSLIPADGDERAECIRLLEELFAIAPDLPVFAITGDGLYHRSTELAHDLEFAWGVHPVFPDYNNAPKRFNGSSWKLGVPKCAHGLMEYDQSNNVWHFWKRQAINLPRGQTAPNDQAVIRWRCPSRLCEPVRTYIAEDPMWHPFFHRAGNHAIAVRRRTFQVRRMVIESVFSSAENLGIGGKDLNVPRFAGDAEWDWLVALNMVSQTARRVVHEEGLYPRALKVAEDARLFESATTTRPRVGPSGTRLQRAQRGYPIEEPRAPASWERCSNRQPEYPVPQHPDKGSVWDGEGWLAA